MLGVAKMETGKLEFGRFPFRPREVVQGVVDTLAFRAHERGLVLVSEAEEPLPPVLLGDPVRLHQVLLNLVGHVIHHAEGGTVTVGLRADRRDEQVRLRFDLSASAKGVETLFERFLRGGEEPPPPQDDGDPGPALVHDIVEGMGGEMALLRRSADAPVLALTVPFAELEGGDYPFEAEQIPDVRLADARILVVEEDEVTRFVLRSMLEHWGAHVEVVTDGHVALERVETTAFDLVLVDLRAPDAGGYEVTRRIRKERGFSTQALPVLALTSSAPVDQREKITEAGINDFIPMPFNPNDLRLRLAFHLGIETPSPDLPRYVNLTFLEEHAFGNDAFVVKMIDLFMKQAPDLLLDLRHARASEDWERVRFVAHKMKSSARMLGIEALTAALQAVERHAGREGRREDLPRRIEEAMAVCRAALEELREERKKYVVQEKGSV